MSARLYVVEDEADIASVLRDYLALAGYRVQTFGDGAEAAAALQAQPPDLLLLDIMLPGLDGLSLLRQVRQRSDLPVILITARVEEIDRLLGLDLGADDYICKPFSPREVVARVKTVLRRRPPSALPQPQPQPLVLEPALWAARVHGLALELTRKEFELLQVLARQPGRIYSRQQLLASVYADDLDVTERAVDSHVKNLRRKLGRCPPAHDWIRSVYGVGFALDLPEPAALPQAGSAGQAG